MRLNYFIGDFDLSFDEVEITDGEFLNQVNNVLRLKAGDSLILGDGKMGQATLMIEELKKGKMRAKVVKREKNTNEPNVNCTLYCSILKRENFELVVQKATEIGIKKIVPIICERTVKTGLKKDRLEKIIKEAAEQSGRGTVPHLSDSLSFDEVLLEKNESEARIIFDKVGLELDQVKIQANKNISIFIGPEGGWTEFELDKARKNNFYIATLGNLTLRAETAAIVSSYLIINFTR